MSVAIDGRSRSADRSVRIGGSVWPVVLPSVRDARLHTAAVVITLHVLGQLAFDFAVSVPQIVSAIAAAAIAEMVITARRHRWLAWPASAMLTGSGVGLILRVEGTAPGDHWTWHRWWWFAAVAVLALLTKYVVRVGGIHVFNPSNVALVATFVLLGSGRVEPLDFSWRPVGPALVVAYVAIVGGGLLITRRLGLLPMAVVFWAALTAGLAALGASGHCMLTPTDALPVCDGRFWRVVITSPETLVFVFFMLTDPRTVPTSSRGRLVFGIVVAAAATLLIAPQRTEFATKVALLGALTIACAARPVLAALAPWVRRQARGVAASGVRPLGRRLTGATSADERGLLVGLAAVAGIAAFGVATVWLGTPARTADASPAPIEAAPLPDVDDIASGLASPPLPEITFDERIRLLETRYLDPAVQESIARAMLDALAIEAELMRRQDPDRLRAVDHGTRLSELQAVIRQSLAGNAPGMAIPAHDVRSAHFVITRVGRQSGPVLGIEARGEVTWSRAGTSTAALPEPWAAVVALRPASDGRWLIIDVRPIGS